MKKMLFLGMAFAAAVVSVASAADEPFPGFDKLRADQPAAAAYMLRRLEAYWKGEAPGRPARTAKIVYFHAADRGPLADYDGRINRWMDDFEAFFRAEFKRNGFGERQLALERTATGRVNIHVVKGAKPDAKYTYESGGPIFREAAEALRPEFNIHQETALVICALSRTEADGKIKLYAPFYGLGGTQRNGICLCVDHELLDAKNFAVKDRQLDLTEHQRRTMSLGEFNTIYLGGALHEFGHGLSLPHDHETAGEAANGTPLMGAGNYTYRAETRGEGKGTYLSFSEAVRLVSHPLFSGHSREFEKQPRLSHGDIAFTEKDGKLVIRGTLESDIPPYAVIAYNDQCPKGKKGNQCNEDYDAETYTSVVNEKGEFEIEVGRLLRGTVELRLVVCHANGATTTIADVAHGYVNKGKGSALAFYGAPAPKNAPAPAAAVQPPAAGTPGK